MTAPASESESFLLQCAELGDRGIQDYGERELAGKVLFWREEGHMWDTEKRLWVQLNAYQLQSRFYRETHQKLEALHETINGFSKEEMEPKTKTKLLANIVSMQKGVNNVNKMSKNWAAITGRLERDFSQLNRSKDTLPLKGGKKINLRTGEISDRTEEDYWSYEILATGTECSEQAKQDNLRYIENLCRDGDGPDAPVDRDMLSYLQRLCGYWMTFETFDKAFYVLAGPSDCGKSHFLERFNDILGNRVGPCGKEVFAKGNEGNHKTYLVKLDGVSMAWTSELEAGQNLNAAITKELTGDKQITYRACYGREEKTMAITVKLVVLLNDMPNMNGGDSGLITRLRKIPFRHTQVVNGRPSEENKKMLARLKTQDGINASFAWFVEGAKAMYQAWDEGMARLDPPESIQDEGKEFMQDSDSFKAFVEDQCQVWTPECGEEIVAFNYKRRALQTDYNNFCKHANFTGPQKLGAGSLVDKVKAMLPQNKTKGRGDWIGIRPKPIQTFGLE